MPQDQRQALDDADRALLQLLDRLQAVGYGFVTPTPETHARVVARPAPSAPTLRDVFGWSRAFRPGQLDDALVALLERGGVLERTAEGLRSRVRASTLHGRLLLHSAYPTREVDSVFFGPDSYRFADWVRRALAAERLGRVVDIGAGAGAGGLALAGCAAVAGLTLTDINPKALRLARINAAHAGVPVETREADDLAGLGRFDVALANPPYIIDPEGRAYRHGGDLHGGRLSVTMAEQALEALNPGGRLFLYTGAAIVNGRNPVCEALQRLSDDRGCTFSCEELDPDVFGEELSRPEYADVDRIAVIGAVAGKPA